VDLPNKKYQIIYADPPYKYIRTGQNSAEREYKTMDLESIKQIPVKDITDLNCHLYLWVTNNHIDQGIELIKAWGFTYKTLITWIKRTVHGKIGLGMGYYFRNSTEHMMFAVKGKMLTTNNSTKNVIEYVNPSKHSEKPKETRDFIVANSGDLSRIELFARSKCDGWDSWGLEIEE
jgi:N6-adenosine-specific RNA methylase IME4